ncbi:MAG: DUF5107 domain-containing protein [Clostridia bacterium]
MSIQKTTIRMPITRLLGENQLPMLRDRDDWHARDAGLLPEEREGLGRGTGFRVLPYRMRDLYEQTPAPRAVEAIVLENQFLRATFLPAWGGRLMSLFDKAHGRELLFANPVIKAGNLALRNAWFSGGIEWNFGHYGHTFFTCENVFFARCAQDGEEFLRMYAFERLTRMVYQVDFHLPDGAQQLAAHMRVYNPTDEDQSIFLWTNTAVEEQQGARVFSGTDEVIVLVEGNAPSENYFTHAKLPHLTDGVDHSIPASIPHAEEYFFQNPHDAAHAFEAIVYPDGRLFYERSTGNYPYRKVFCWGGHAGGKRWQEHLSTPGGGAYLEVQSGLFPTQQHAGTLKAHQVLSLTQLFGGTIDGQDYEGAYAQAQALMAKTIAQLLPPGAVDAAHARYERMAERPADVLLHRGDGWGALEKVRCPNFLPPHLDFPSSTMDGAQRPWLELLNGEVFAGGASFMTAREWIPVMARALEKQPNNTALQVHLGLAHYEQGAYTQAEALWQRAGSEDGAYAALALRNLATAKLKQGDSAGACVLMAQALKKLGAPTREYAEDYMAMLNATGAYDATYAYYEGLPESLREGERARLLACLGANAVADEVFLDRQFAHTFSVFREGDRQIVDLWFEAQARREANRRRIVLSDELLKEIRATRIPPRRLDFRMK